MTTSVQQMDYKRICHAIAADRGQTIYYIGGGRWSCRWRRQRVVSRNQATVGSVWTSLFWNLNKYRVSRLGANQARVYGCLKFCNGCSFNLVIWVPHPPTPLSCKRGLMKNLISCLVPTCFFHTYAFRSVSFHLCSSVRHSLIPALLTSSVWIMHSVFWDRPDTN